MRKVQLYQKVEAIKSISVFEHKLIDSIHSIMLLKRQAENDYKLAL